MKRKIRNIYAYIYMYLNEADIFHDIFSILAYRIKKKKSKNNFNVCTSKN